MNEALYNAAHKIFLENGVPADLAERAAHICGKDDADLPNFGRSPEESAIIREVWVLVNDRNANREGQNDASTAN